MFKRMKNKKGFTLIELMIVVAIVGILAAIAIPAYIDYTIRARITEVVTGYDALSTALSEYHASNGRFPTIGADAQPATMLLSDVVAVTQKYGNYTQFAYTSADDNTFSVTITGIGSAVDSCVLYMQLQYDTNQGYLKSWPTTGTGIVNPLEPRYLPRT